MGSGMILVRKVVGRVIRYSPLSSSVLIEGGSFPAYRGEEGMAWMERASNYSTYFLSSSISFRGLSQNMRIYQKN